MADLALEDAVRRNCEALTSGNFVQILADLTPQAMSKLMQLAGSQMSGAPAAGAAGGGMGMPVPRFTGYEIVDRTKSGDDDVYDVRFRGDANFGVKAHWREIDGYWKLTDFEPYEYPTAPGATGSP